MNNVIVKSCSLFILYLIKVNVENKNCHITRKALQIMQFVSFSIYLEQ